MASNTYAGAGTSLSSNYYMRNYYISNRDARTASKRKSMDNHTLSLADGLALRRAVKRLGTSDFSDENEESIRNSAAAFIETYNNALSSTSVSSDSSLTRNMKQLKAITSEYSNELDKIGITVNSDGTMTKRDTLFTSASIDKFKDLFSSDSDFMQRTASCAKRIERRSEALGISDKNQLSKERSASNTVNSNTVSEPTTATQIFSQSVDLDTLLHTGIGQNVNLIL